jgi:hypothetical protein
METLKNIIRESNMSTRPEFYSGRGATLSDLNGQILQEIYNGIEKHFGDEAAENYVKMVDGIKVLSATTFLQELYDLYYSGWKYTPEKEDASGIAVHKDEDGNYNTALGMFGVSLALSNDRDDTNSIKAGFLLAHGIKPEAGEMYCPFGSHLGY